MKRILLAEFLAAAVATAFLLPADPEPDPEPDPDPPVLQFPTTIETLARPTGCGFVPPPKTLDWLARHQNPDGSWGDDVATLEGRAIGRTGITALAVTCFVEAGRASYSNEDLSGRTAGSVVLRGQDWLLADQRYDGRFLSAKDEAFDQALGAYGLCQVFGYTGHAGLRDPAQRAVDALLQMQKPDGGWDGIATTAWALLALWSARIDDLEVPEEAWTRATRVDAVPAHPGRTLALALRKSPDAGAEADRLLQDARETMPSSVAFWHLGSIAILMVDGPRSYGERPSDSRRFDGWFSILKRALFLARDRDGGFAGKTAGDRVVATSLGQMAETSHWSSQFVVSKKR